MTIVDGVKYLTRDGSEVIFLGNASGESSILTGYVVSSMANDEYVWYSSGVSALVARLDVVGEKPKMQVSHGEYITYGGKRVRITGMSIRPSEEPAHGKFLDENGEMKVGIFRWRLDGTFIRLPLYADTSIDKYCFKEDLRCRADFPERPAKYTFYQNNNPRGLPIL